MSSKPNGTLYIGVTNDLLRRVQEHKEKIKPGFSKKYNVINLVYYEVFEDIYEAITREKRLKKWNRQWKLELISKFNPQWKDLFNEIKVG
jgi:putative endonuclease